MATHIYSRETSDPIDIRGSCSRWIVTRTGAILPGTHTGMDESGSFFGNEIAVNGMISANPADSTIFTMGQPTSGPMPRRSNNVENQIYHARSAQRLAF